MKYPVEHIPWPCLAQHFGSFFWLFQSPSTMVVHAFGECPSFILASPSALFYLLQKQAPSSPFSPEHLWYSSAKNSFLSELKQLISPLQSLLVMHQTLSFLLHFFSAVSTASLRVFGAPFYSSVAPSPASFNALIATLSALIESLTFGEY
jgi:hypothetical protein